MAKFLSFPTFLTLNRILTRYSKRPKYAIITSTSAGISSFASSQGSVTSGPLFGGTPGVGSPAFAAATASR